MSRSPFDLNNIWCLKKNNRYGNCLFENEPDLDEKNIEYEEDSECVTEPDFNEYVYCESENDLDLGERNIESEEDSEGVTEPDFNEYSYEFVYKHDKHDSDLDEVHCGDIEEECDTNKKKSKPRTKWTFLQEVKISPEHWNVVFQVKTNSIDKNMFKQYKNLIAKQHIDPIVGCIALIKAFYIGCKKVYNGSEVLTMWMYCQHLNCNRKFKLTCSLHEAKDGLFQLFRSNDDQTHIKYLTRQVREIERKMYKEKLLTMMPMELRRECIENAKDELLEQQNLQDVKSDAVYHKIRQEGLQSIDLDKDDMKDLELMMNDGKAFIQKIIKKPFAVYIFSKAQCSVIPKLLNDNPDSERVGHLDATGGVIRNPFDDDILKQIYYYACIVNIKIGVDLVGTLIPIFELVSECQEAPFLAEWVFAFKTFFRATYPHIRSPFHRIVVDKSYALIHAVLEGFNNMSVVEYLQMSYKVVAKTMSMDSFFLNLVKIHLCYTHLSKVISKNILKAFNLKKHSTETRFLKEVLQFLAKSKSYEQIKHAFYHLATLFVNEFQNKDVEDSYKVLNELMTAQNEKADDYFNKEMLGSQEEVEEDEINVESIQINNTIYGSSRFYHDFNTILQERCKTFFRSPSIRQKLLKSKTLKNPFHNMEFLQTFAKNYLSILPMWTGILITDPNIIVYHNQHVESNFRISKECFKRKPVALGKLPTKCGRYIRANIQRTERDIKGFKWNIGKFRLASNRPKPENRKRKKDQSDYFGLSEAKEKWMRKRPRMSKKTTVRKPVEVEVQSVTDNCPFIGEASNFFQENTEIEVRPYFPEPISRKSIDLKNKLENGLVDDFRYYKTVENFNYVVAVNQKHRLMSEDFSCLSGTNWFSNTLVEYLIQLLLRKSKNIEASCVGADLFFLDPSKEMAFKQFRNNYVLLPLLDGRHFVLFILNLKEKIISYIDPLGEQQKEFQKYIENFNLFLIKYNLKFKNIGDISEWKVKKYEHSFQTDFVNCGPFVVRFCELFILKGEICYEEFDPYRYRRELQNMVLATSQNGMEDTCLCCGQHSSKNTKDAAWIQCDMCDRWLHANFCANVNIDDYPDDSPYKCPLCLSMSV